MGKTRKWVNYFKSLFTPNSKPKSQEKSRNWGRAVSKKLKFKRRRYYLAAEESPRTTLNEAAEEQRKKAVAVAVATAAAAEVAIAAANSAFEVVRLANAPYGAERRISFSAAVKIQTAYRGHLARKALSALKGIVKLQAIVRGQLVRKNILFLVHQTKEFKEKRTDQNSTAVETSRLAKLKLGTALKNGTLEQSRKSTSFCHTKQKSTEENVASLPNSPGYMAATECTKARLRSLSTPRQRMRLCETYSGRDYKFGLSSGHSFNGEIIARTQKRNSDF